MKESKLNSILNKSFKHKGFFSHKIADPRKEFATMSSENPFDVFAVTNKGCYYIESKLIKGDYKAFNFKTIRPHQMENLNKISVCSNMVMENVYPLIAVGIWIPYKTFEVLFFNITTINKRLNDGDKSIKKKELLELSEKGFSSIIRKEFLDVDTIKII